MSKNLLFAVKDSEEAPAEIQDVTKLSLPLIRGYAQLLSSELRRRSVEVQPTILDGRVYPPPPKDES